MICANEIQMNHCIYPYHQPLHACALSCVILSSVWDTFYDYLRACIVIWWAVTSYVIFVCVKDWNYLLFYIIVICCVLEFLYLWNTSASYIITKVPMALANIYLYIWYGKYFVCSEIVSFSCRRNIFVYNYISFVSFFLWKCSI